MLAAESFDRMTLVAIDILGFVIGHVHIGASRDDRVVVGSSLADSATASKQPADEKRPPRARSSARPPNPRRPEPTPAPGRRALSRRSDFLRAIGAVSHGSERVLLRMESDSALVPKRRLCTRNLLDAALWASI
jgi:hypothetical protein